MGSAREFFEGVRAAQALIDGALARIESMRQREGVRAQRYDALGRSYHDPSSAMEGTEARIDAEERVRRQCAEWLAEVERGRRVCAGVRGANPGQMWADAIELRYIDRRSWQEVASALGVTTRQAQAWASTGLDWVDSVGIAAAESGMGQAQLF